MAGGAENCENSFPYSGKDFQPFVTNNFLATNFKDFHRIVISPYGTLSRLPLACTLVASESRLKSMRTAESNWTLQVLAVCQCLYFFWKYFILNAQFRCALRWRYAMARPPPPRLLKPRPRQPRPKASKRPKKQSKSTNPFMPNDIPPLRYWL